ncbi:MAG: heme o synthase [Candidatus Methylarchaceae archaeon HK01B]|nr:heme o synthase [Candidatus Methylarchaceae archaeon HK02M1]MCP8319284.1 heme o synthase [Candidatus Methylarchaceae archaeon HK01B]
MNTSTYWQLTKPRIAFAIISLYILSLIISSSGNFKVESLIGAIAVFTSIAGSNAINCYIDRDIDQVMARTKRRPIPSGKVKAKDALMFGIFLICISFVLASFLGYLPIFFLFLGLFSYIILYTILLKRRSILNVFATAPAIATPVWFGWVIGREMLDLQGLLMSSLVMLWGPLHLWSLATTFSRDYRKVSIPMLPSVVGRKKACGRILVLSIILSLTSILMFFLGYYGFVYLIGATILNAILIFLSVRAVLRPTNRRSWLIYKFSAPYIGGLFLMALF